MMGALILAVGATAGAELIADGDFEACPNGATLRRDDRGQDWYESRKDTKEGRRLLKLSTKNIGGNATHKAMIKAHPELNTYLTQRFSEPQTGRMRVQYDVFVREILPDDNHSAFCFVGASNDRKRGPNSTDRERFVYLAFENSQTSGKLNIVAREGKNKWKDRTIVARDLDPERWYTITLEIDIKGRSYDVTVEGVTTGVELEAFRTGRKPLKKLTHISFASWNDGAGTFYVDNVSAIAH